MRENFLFVIARWILKKFRRSDEGVYYVNGAEVLPPPLSKEVESEMISRIGEDEDARQMLIEHNLRLVVYIAKRFENTGAGLEDLVSIGTIGLIKAVDTFRVSCGARFATYAARCIQNEILMNFRARKKLAAEVSLSDTIDVDRDGNPLTYMDVISTEESLAEEMERKMCSERAVTLVERVLTPRERKIISLRYGLGGRKAMTQREIADAMGISRSYVSRIEKSALEKLKDNWSVC